MTAPESNLAPDTMLAGRYRILRTIGSGGMATVYVAEEIKHDREVAIKVLRPEFVPADGNDRFLREIGIAARLSHPHLVPLIDSGESDGLRFYVSPFITGGSLRDRLRRESRLSVADALRITNEVGAALDFANRAGFIHRDVKPENILFADGMALLADFGIARACCGELNEGMTSRGLAVGTPEYMSPEQASGESGLDARSDVYGLACVLFEMLVGEAPFSGSSVRSIMARQVTETPRRVRALRPEVGSEVDAAIAKALMKEQSRRFNTVADFVAALGTFSQTQGRPAYAGAKRSIAVLPFVNASPDPDNEYLSDGITDELIDAFAKMKGIRVASRTSVFALKNKPQDVRAIGALLDCTVVLEGTVRRSGSQLRITAQLTSTEDGGLIWSQRYDRELDDVFAIQDEIARTIVNTLRATSLADPTPAVARRHTENVAAHRLYLKGRYEWNRRTQEGVANGIRLFEQAIAEDPNYALAYTGLADAYALGVDYRSVPVDEGLKAAKEYARRAIALDDSLAEAHASLAWALFIYDWDWAGADAAFRRAIDLDPQYAATHQWYAMLLLSRGLVGEALVEAHTAVELDAGSVSGRRSLGWVYYYARRYDQARYHLERAVEMNPNAEETLRVLGLSLVALEEYEEAIRVLKDADAMREAGSYTHATLAYALARAGREDAAREILRRLEEAAAREYVSPVAIATIYLGLRELDQALDWMERCLPDRRGWLAYLRVNPMLDAMRGYPRYEALVQRVGL